MNESDVQKVVNNIEYLMKIFLLAPNYCWHTEDLLKLTKYSKRLNYIFVADTPIFLSRRFYEKYFNLLNISYEFWQRFGELFFVYHGAFI